MTQNNSKKLFNVKTFNDERYSKNQDFYSVSYIIFWKELYSWVIRQNLKKDPWLTDWLSDKLKAHQT